jgi:hypothetical protein
MAKELPPPDVLDQAGRMKRLLLSLILGASAAAIGYVIASNMIKPDDVVGDYQQRGAHKLVGYITGLAGGIVLTISLVVQNHLAKKKYQASRGLPAARMEK